MNSFGRIFRITIFGESHGAAIGVSIDGVPAGIHLSTDDFTTDLNRRMAGAKVSIFDNAIEVSKNQLNPFHFDATHCPDLFPPLVALAAHGKGESRISGVSRLRVKESDRAATLQQEFAKLGVEIKISGELMYIFGGKVDGGKVHSHHDHRIAMASAIAALSGNGEVEIENAKAVSKSYPDFFKDMIAMGAQITLLKDKY